MMKANQIITTTATTLLFVTLNFTTASPWDATMRQVEHDHSIQARIDPLFEHVFTRPVDASKSPVQFRGQVIGIKDGDTITVLRPGNHQETIRLYGIDAPEMGQPYGLNAKKALSEMIFSKSVIVKVTGIDRYGRKIGKVEFLHHGNTWEAGQVLVWKGLAWHYKKYAGSDRQLALNEQEARGGKRGIWGSINSNARIAPWDWRKGERESKTNQIRSSAHRRGQSSTSGEYWINQNSGIRHNSGCRYFKVGHGVPGSKAHGTACKICGG